MSAFTVERYGPARKAQWDQFVAASKNGTFLFFRDYLEYHRDRFVDASLLVLDERGQVAALLPASRHGDVVKSHGGLTYGGLVTGDAMTLPTMLEVLEALLGHLKADGVASLDYRPVPAPYHRQPAGEDLVAMFLLGAALGRRSALTVLQPASRLPFQERRRRGVKKATAAGITVGPHADLAGYWALLGEVLRQTHGAAPVHSLAEMQQLQGRFPDHIKLVGAHRDGRLVAGVLIYESATVARAQYIAAGDEGKELQALDLLFHVLLTETYAAKPWFDFGTSERHGPTAIQKGLLEQKEGFGARVVPQDGYLVDLARFVPGALRGALT